MMHIEQVISIYCGGKGSGCNPKAGKCGRHSSSKGKSDIPKMEKELKKLGFQKSDFWSTKKETNWKSGLGDFYIENKSGKFSYEATHRPIRSYRPDTYKGQGLEDLKNVIKHNHIATTFEKRRKKREEEGY